MLTRHGRQDLARLLSVTGRAAGLYIAACCQYWYESRRYTKRLYYKAIIASEISSQEPAHRVLRFIDYLKDDVYKVKGKYSFKVAYTRQQIADILGLRVETVIRVIKSLEKKGDVKISKRKVYR